MRRREGKKEIKGGDAMDGKRRKEGKEKERRDSVEQDRQGGLAKGFHFLNHQRNHNGLGWCIEADCPFGHGV